MEGIENQKELKPLNKYFFNIMLLGTLSIAILFIFISTIKPSDNVVLIRDAQRAVSLAQNPNDVELNQWNPVLLPAPAQKKNADLEGYQWFSVILPAKSNQSGVQSILIRNLPQGAKLYLDNVEFLQNSVENNDIARANSMYPVLVTLPYLQLSAPHTLSIKTKSKLLLWDLEPIYFGGATDIDRLYKAFFTLNILLSKISYFVALIFIAIFGLAWYKNRGVSIFREIFLLNVFWLLWIGPIGTNGEDINNIFFIELSNSIVISALLYFFLKSSYYLAGLKVGKLTKYYYVGYAVISIGLFLFRINDITIKNALIVGLFLIFSISFFPVIYQAKIKKEWGLLAWCALFIASFPIVLHDFTVWLRLLPSWYSFLHKIVPEFFLQSTQLSHLIAIPYFFTTSLIVTRAIDEREFFRLGSIITAQKERLDIIRDLHDGLGASLTMAYLQTKSKIPNFYEIQTSLLECLDELRLIINGFDDDTSNLSSLIEVAATQAQRVKSKDGSPIRISYHLPVQVLDEVKLNPKKNLQIARIVKEILVNAIKHSGGNQINIKLTYHKKIFIIIEISDNGEKGFNYNEALLKNSGHGLKNINQRVRDLHGDISYASKLEGTKATISIPLAENVTN